jgi:hypothetical protein
VRQIAVEAPTVCTVLLHPTRSAPPLARGKLSLGALAHRAPALSCSMTERSPTRKPNRAAHQATRSEVPAARLPILVALPRYSWHE